MGYTLGVFKHEPQQFWYVNECLTSPCNLFYFTNGNYIMTIGSHVLWCGFDPAIIESISGEWATIRFDDTKTSIIVNIRHLREV
jgi:hypothetical protein